MIDTALREAELHSRECVALSDEVFQGLVPLQYSWGFIGCSWHWKCDEGPGTGNGWSNRNDTVVNTLYVVGTPTCTVQCEILVWDSARWN